MFTNAMSSAEHSQNIAEPCLHEVRCVLAVFHRANARERDAAKRRRAALRAGVRQMPGTEARERSAA